MSTPSIRLTDSAVNKISVLMQEEKDPSLKLRIYIMGGGCSGFQYGFAFEKESREDDFSFEYEMRKQLKARKKNLYKVRLLVDPMSFQYLDASEIDYVNDPHGERFIVRNPNAKTTCGCGNSFTIAEESEDPEDQR